jgi:hypothetical protein
VRIAAARAIVPLALALAAVGAAAPVSRATDECRGLQRCIPIAGPWVVIPASNHPTSAVWQLKCPEGVVAGLDARVSDRSVAVGFPGLIGSPVNPGITTTDRVVFKATYVGHEAKATTFKPFIGCIPAAGGRRTPTSAAAARALAPGQPITTRVKTLRVLPSKLARATYGCQPGERLLGAAHAIGLYTSLMPPQEALFVVQVVQTVVDDQILVSATRSELPPDVRDEVQIHAVCAR